MTPLVNPIPSDEQIKKEVVDHLCWDSRVDAANVAVEVHQGTVTLSGHVPSPRERRAARDGARDVRGVRDVVDQLAVVHPGGELRPTDDHVLQAVQDALKRSGDVDASGISVQVSSGAVALRGHVESYWQRTLAEELAGGMDGVVEIHNELAVVPTEDIDDEAIAANIEGALERSAYLDAEDVTVRVEDGTVTLSGALPTLTAYRSACEAAVYTAGVRNFVNDLVVGTPEQELGGAPHKGRQTGDEATREDQR